MRVLIVILVISVILYMNLSEYFFKKDLFETSIASKIIKVEFKGRGGYFYYYDDKNFSGDYFSMSRQTQYLKVGDSIYKKENSCNLKTFKKNSSGEYVFYRAFMCED